MLGRVQLWPAEMSPAQGRKSEVKKEVEQWHQELDQIIKRIQELEIECVVDESCFTHDLRIVVLTQK